MAYPCQKAFEYPSYECYKNIKRQFVERQLDIITDIKQFEEEHARDIGQELSGLSNVFTKFKKYISNTHVFISGEYDGQGTCNYISYLLCDQIRDKNDGCDKSKFDIFKEFVDRYNGRKKNSICKDVFKYIEDKEFKKMETIYKLYELYDKHKSPRLNVDNPCESFGNIIANYIIAIKKYDNEDGNDSNLIKKLLDLKDLALKSNIPSYKTCPHRITEFIKPELYLKRLEEIETKRRQDEELQKQQQELQKQKEQEELLERQKLQEREKLHTDESLRKGEDLSLELIAQQNETEPSLGVVSPRGAEYVVGKPFSRPFSFLPERLRSQTELEQTEGGYPELKDKSMDTSPTSGITGTITDTISGFIKEVDPAPVLGVSGGMGVLFILFKYTPFGSFFGGRRRRMHQIPSSFRGFPPDFANFQEYGGGYVGYSPMDINPLAE
ncbi:unnamed protein product [Plasmodium vivax]|uniref:(malaria parasite P. vivax) hypothetical protein n=1 Tax=Plasmodium vivax TaxID=5855 RepID=A0A8S4H4A4_PLAVI|nr:unnamed protein product [Plasmodium vivax]CAI7718667.1 hypothetical protein, conserved [Plasmodium vivax]